MTRNICLLCWFWILKHSQLKLIRFQKKREGERDMFLLSLFLIAFEQLFDWSEVLVRRKKFENSLCCMRGTQVKRIKVSFLTRNGQERENSSTDYNSTFILYSIKTEMCSIKRGLLIMSFTWKFLNHIWKHHVTHWTEYQSKLTQLMMDDCYELKLQIRPPISTKCIRYDQNSKHFAILLVWIHDSTIISHAIQLDSRIHIVFLWKISCEIKYDHFTSGSNFDQKFLDEGILYPSVTFELVAFKI